MSVVWKIEADFDNDGVYEEDLTARVGRPAGGLTISRGLSKQGIYQISQLTLALRNEDGRFTPGNKNSPLAGRLEPGVPLRVVATHNAANYTLWTGYIQDWSFEWMPGEIPVARLRATDIADYLRRYSGVNVTSSTTRKTDDALNDICDAMNIPSELRSFDVGQQSLPFHFVRMANAMTAIMDVVKSELGGIFWVTRDGKLRFESRASRLGVTPDQTWGDGTNVVPAGVTYDLSEDEFITEVTVRATVFQQGQDEIEVFAFSRGMDNRPADSLALDPKQVYEAEFHFASPVLTVAEPVARRDYLANSAVDGSGEDMTGDLSVQVTHLGAGFRLRLENMNATTTLYVTRFRLRGTVDAFIADQPHFVAAKSVPGQVSEASAELDIPFADDSTRYPAHYAMSTLRTYRYPPPYLTLRFLLEAHNDIASALLLAEIGQLIRYKDTALGTASAQIDDWWYIEGLTYRIEAGAVTEATALLVPSYIYRNLDAIAYDLFTRADQSGLGQALSGQTWAGDDAFAIESNQAKATASGMPYVDLGSGDCVVEVDVSGIPAGSKVGVIYRYADTNNYWAAYYDRDTGQVRLRKMLAGTPGETVAVVGGKTMLELRALVQGSRHRVYVDRKLYLDLTDGDLATNTNVGLFAELGAGTVVYFDDFYAQGV